MQAVTISSGVRAFEKNMGALNTVLSKTPENLVTESARSYTNAIRGSINAATNGGKLRGVGKRGARVGVRYTVRGGESNTTAIVQATGPLQLIERDTRAHPIPRTQGSRRQRTAAGRLSQKRELTGRSLSGRSILFIPGSDHPIFGPVKHPGTRGKHPFAKGVSAAETKAFVDATNAFSRSIAGVFRG